MGIDTRPVKPWEMLQVEGVTIDVTPIGGLVIEMTVDGAARLARSLTKIQQTGRSDDFLGRFLVELIRNGKVARRKTLRPGDAPRATT